MFKKQRIPILLGSILLFACQTDEGSQVDDNQEPSTEETTPTEENENEDEDEDEDEDEEASDTTHSSNEEEDSKKDLEDIDEKEYDTEEEAADSIDRYQEVKETNTDLGHGIEALSEGAAGHQYVSWNEGRWLIEIDFPLDPENAVEDYQDGEELAKAIVDYLEENQLPAPNEIGTISIRSMKTDPETIIKWQDGKTVYTIEKEVSDPLEAIKIAIEYEEEKR